MPRLSWLSVQAVLLALLLYHARWLYLQLGPAPKLSLSFVSSHPGATTDNTTASCHVVHTPKASQALIGQKFGFCEDGIAWPAADAAILACDPGRPNWNTVMGPLRDPEPRGALWVLSTTVTPGKDSKPVPVALEGLPAGHDFHPLGMSVLTDDVPLEGSERSATLLVVNHQRDCSTVDVFKLYQHESSINGGDVMPESTMTTSYRAKFVRSLRHPKIRAPNSVAFVTPTSFYLSEDHLFTKRSQWALFKAFNHVETLLGLPGGSVSFVTFNDSTASSPVSKEQEAGQMRSDNVEVETVARGIPFANGLAISPNGKFLAVAASTGLSVHLFERQQVGDSDGDSKGAKTSFGRRLTRAVAKIPVPFTIDNIGFTKEYAGDHRVAVQEDADARARAHDSSSSSSSSRSDPALSFDFGGAALVAAGHPYGLHLIAMAKDPYNPSKAAPSWVVSITPRASSAPREANESDSAPVPANGRSLWMSGGEGYTVRTLYQGKGGADCVFPTSTTGVWDPHSGSLVVTGLYANGVLTCTGVF